MKWEYKVMTLWSDSLSEIDDNISSDNQELLNEEGLKFWELVSVDNGIAYFKRPLRTKSEAEILAHFDYPRLDRSSEV